MGLHFSKEEFSNRKEKTLNSMKNEGVDALIMFRQESMYWLTGYDTFGFVFFQALVLDQRGNVILLTRAPDLRQAQNTSNISDIRIWVDKDGANPADDLKIILDELNLKGKKIKFKKLNLNNLKTSLESKKNGLKVTGNTNIVYINPLNCLRFVLNKVKKEKINLDKDFYVFTGSTVCVLPFKGKGLYKGTIDKIGSVSVNIR